MAKIRKFSAYRRLERPYTRISKYRKKSYVRARPHSNIVKFDMGLANKDYDNIVLLNSKADLQIRHNALEAARQTSNRYLERNVGKKAFHLKIRVYPHHILRENPLASGAGADRMSTGMKKSFGKSISVAAQIHKGQTLMHVRCQKKDIAFAKIALKRASNKFPCSCSILVQ